MSHVDEGTLHAYLDGELAASERARLEAHLAGCDACRARLQEERELIARAGALLALAAPPEQAAPPLGTVRRRSLLRRARLPAAWAASVVLALAAGWYAGTVRREPVTQVLEESLPLVSTEVPKASEPQAPATRRARGQAAPDLATRERSRADRTAEPDVARPTEAPVPAAALVATPTLNAASITLDSARAVLGAEPVTVPDLPVGDVRASAADAGAVIVEQPLAPGVAVELHQRRATAGPLPVSQDEGRAQARLLGQRAVQERLARYVGPLRVEIAGPLPPDSLSRLLERVRPVRREP